MFPEWIDPDLLAACLCAVLPPAAGLVGLLVRFGSPWHRRGLSALAAAFGALGAAAAVTGLPRLVCLGPALLAAVCGLLLLLGTDLPARACAWVLGRLRAPRLPWLVLTAAGPALLALWACRLDTQAPPVEPEAAPPPAHEAVPLVPTGAAPVFTDAGHELLLYRPARESTADELKAGEAQTFAAWGLAERAIRTAPAGQECNCHGWVFAGGSAWVRSEDVPTILDENRYERVSDPRPGDLVVYRHAGEVVHSGVVLAAGPGGRVLVESKFGRVGRFIHEPEAARYGSYDFYRSARPGHRLRDAATPGGEVQG
jgi:hypothetical protein